MRVYLSCGVVLMFTVGFIVHYMLAWSVLDASFKAEQNSLPPLACKDMRELNWSEWFSSPAEETRRLQCHHHKMIAFSYASMPNPAIEIVSFLTLVVTEPLKVTMLSMSYHFLYLVAIYGAAPIYTSVCLLIAVLYVFVCRRRKGNGYVPFQEEYDLESGPSFYPYPRQHIRHVLYEKQQQHLLEERLTRQELVHAFINDALQAHHRRSTINNNKSKWPRLKKDDCEYRGSRHEQRKTSLKSSLRMRRSCDKNNVDEDDTTTTRRTTDRGPIITEV